MELQLGLALPSSPSEGHDQNCHELESKELELRLNSWDLQDSCFSRLKDHDHYENSNSISNITDNKKRGFDEAFDNDEQSFTAVPRTLPLLQWDSRSSDEDYPDNSSAPSNVDGVARSNMNSTYVKVQMEGVPIARKVDLSICTSQHMLQQTLMDMFSTWKEEPYGYRLAYQDKGGDWRLAEDVPWGSFIQSVQRLKLVKNSTTVLD